MSFPKTTDPNFYQFINSHYKRYTIPSTHKTVKQICFPSRYELQLPQKFLANFINPNTPYRGVLVYHQIGSGKTCTAIRIAENFKGEYQILIVIPASLKGNFRSELRSQCADQNYITENERNKLKELHPSQDEYKAIIRKSDQRIDRYYTIYSYNKFVDLLKNNQINFRKTLLIIDEVHNMISETGAYYSLIYERLCSCGSNRPKDMRLVLMSATPIFDKPIEIALTMNLLLPQNQQLPVGSKFIDTYMDIKVKNGQPHYQIKNMDDFKERIRGYISYFRGAQPNVFPSYRISLVRCEMSKPQYKLYKQVLNYEKKKYKVIDYVNSDISNSFYIGTRMISNFMYPNKRIGETGYESLEDQDFEPQRLSVYSPKFLKIMKKVRNAQGTIFIYSSFKEYGGIKVLVRMFEAYGYRNYEEYGSGRKRFAIWSGDVDQPLKDEIKAVFNNVNNTDGSQIKIIIGSPSLREGVTLLRVQQVHILEPYWNMSRINQILGRAIRFCSHRDVEVSKRFVRVYIYLAVYKDIKESIDQRIMKIALNKRYVNHEFEKAMKEAAIDCELFYNGNVYKGDEPLKCVT
jgi:hypothetical protein